MKTQNQVHFDRSFQSKPSRRYGGFSGWQGLRAYTFGILAFLLLSAFVTPCSAYGADSVNSYVASVLQLVQNHREALPRLIAPANATADALVHGSAFYLTGDKGWVIEGLGRAGGLMVVRQLSPSRTPAKGDVVWISYLPETYAAAAQQAKEFEDKGCLVVAFGPKPASGAPHFTHWIDSLTPPNADENLARMGNVISLWTLTAEVAASASRQGKTLVFWQSIAMGGSSGRDALYRGKVFHDGLPQMVSTPPGVLSQDYLVYIQNMLQNIREWELSKIIAVGKEMDRQAAEGHPAVIMVESHMMPYAVNHDSKLFRFVEKPDELQSQLHRGGLLIDFGYDGVYLDLWQKVHAAGATAAWIVAPHASEVNFWRFGDVVIDQHWTVGDCAVEAPGYDVRILPPSGIAQLFIYETLVRAAEAQ
jgi:hypothetical protein